jgi:hypothetical protein
MKELAGGGPMLLLGALLVGGCGMPDAASITGLHFTTSSAPGNAPLTNVDVTLTDPGRSRAIYQATLALPDFPSGTLHCPVDLGYRHTVVFMSGQDAAVTATLTVGGCRGATISGASSTRQTNDAYWALLAQDLGIEESTLFSPAAP